MSRIPIRRVPGAVVAIAACLVLAALSTASVPIGNGDAVVRMSWRTDGVHVEECRTLTEEELEQVAPHMRRPVDCSGRVAEYRLTVDVDGRRALTDTLVPAGLWRDRPVYVLRELRVSPGVHRVAVVFEALIPDDYTAPVPTRFEWEGPIALDQGQVGLVTLEPETASLRLR